MIEAILEPWRHEFMVRAFASVTLAGALCGVVGVYVVLRRMAFVGSALAHTVLPGLVFAFVQGWNLILGAILAAVGSALGIGWLTRRTAVREDTAIGLVYPALFAVGILMMSRTGSYRGFDGLLFGSPLTVTGGDLALLGGLGMLVLAVLGLLHKELELSSVDDAYARAIGVGPDRLRYILLVAIALTVVAALPAIGLLLTSALLVAPAAAGVRLARSLSRAMVASALIGGLSGIGGLYIAWYADVAPGAAVVLLATAAFGMAAGWRGWRDQRRPMAP